MGLLDRVKQNQTSPPAPAGGSNGPAVGTLPGAAGTVSGQALPGPLVVAEEEKLVLPDRPPNVTAKLIAFEWIDISAERI